MRSRERLEDPLRELTFDADPEWSARPLGHELGAHSGGLVRGLAGVRSAVAGMNGT